VRWAGPKSNGKEPVSLRLGFSSHPFSYCFDLGLLIPSNSAFDFDPEMKRECLWHGFGMDAKSLCADRRNTTLRTRAAGGKWTDVDLSLSRHNPILVGELESDEVCVPIRLEKDDGATVVQGGDLLSQFGWKWPSR